MGIVVIGDVFIDVKGYSTAPFIPGGRNAGVIQQIHGGVGRNVVEDIANIELKPTFVSLVDDDAMGDDVIRKLERHKVDTRYMRKVKKGMGTWLAVFDQDGDVVASISKRPDHRPIEQILDEHGDEIFQDADSVVIEIDIDKEIVKKTFHYAEKYGKKVYALVSNMTIAIERRDFLRRTACFVCNQQEAGISAAERLEHITRDELAGMLYENSDEPYCEELAKAITDEIRKGNHMNTTTKLRQVIEKTLDFLPEKEKKETIKKTCQRTFQALRIDVNREFEVLYEFMEKLPGALKPGGRAAILTFHSGEDKLVKKALKAGYKEGIYSDYSRDVIRPSAQECAQNGRARSTKMRWAIKSE